MRKVILGLMIIFVSLFIFFDVEANNINSIKMDIYLDSYGNAHVTEVWDAYLDEGTEGYRAYTNLDGATISNFSVKDETRIYDSLSSWNTSGSFSSKAYKSGINRISDGVELCFGISKYGNHTYTLTYTINGFVFEASDAQVIYWQFINSDLASMTDEVYIKIHADHRFSDSLDVWGYGNYGGYAYVYDGYIEISNYNLGSDEYMVGLVKFDKGTFNTTNIKNDDFNYYYTMAEEGSTHYVDETDDRSFFTIVLGIIVSVINFILVFGIIIFSIVKSGNTSGGSYKLDFGKDGKKLPREVNMFRDIPCNKDVFRAYWVANNYGLMKKKTDFLGAIILKWLKEKKIEIQSSTVGKIFKKEETCIVFPSETPNLETQLENDLYNYMYKASKDGILQSKEFETWCRNNYSKILKWFDKVLDYESDMLVEEGMITKNTKKVLLFNTTIYTVNPMMKNEAIEMKGLKEFFKYFENMEDKEAIQVMLWEEYLIFAQIFGVADKVAKQFKKLYPDVITDYDYESVVFVRNVTYTGMRAANTARSRAQSYSSGGGGFSSGGGGGGSFGGGGGGFR